MSIFKQHSNFFLKHITIALIIALGAIGITSCSTDDDSIVNLPNESAAVLFHTVVDKDIQTRGASMDNDALKSESFGVLAYYTANNAWSAASASATPNFMYNQKVAWSTTNTTWNYSPMKYWPNNTNDKVSFFAYAPYEETPATGANKGIKLSSNTTNDTPAIDFTVNSNITNQVDLVYASAKDKNKELVDFQFKHALSRIGFSAKAADDYGPTTIKVKSISISGKFYPSGKLNLLDGTWNDVSATDVTYKKEGLDITLNNATEQQLFGEEQYLMIIPKNFTETNHKIKVTVTYKTTTNGDESDVITKVVYIEDKNFKQSEAYNIVLNISLEGITSEVTYIPYGKTVPVKLKDTTIKVTKTDGTEVGNISINAAGKYTYNPKESVDNDTPVTMNYSYLVPGKSNGTFEDVYSLNTTVGDLKSGVSLDFGGIKYYRVTGNIKYNYIGLLGTDLRVVPANASLSVLSNNATAKMLSAGRYELITTNILGGSDLITINYYGSYFWPFQGNYKGSKYVSTLRDDQYFELKII